MRGHGALMWMCVGMAVIALVVVLAAGSPAYLLPAVGCMLMMAAMMWMMMRGTGR